MDAVTLAIAALYAMGVMRIWSVRARSEVHHHADIHNTYNDRSDKRWCHGNMTLDRPPHSQ